MLLTVEVNGHYNRIRRHCEHQLRGLLLQTLRAVLQRTQKEPDTSELQSGDRRISRILIARTSHNLGDVVMASAIVDECRKLFPQAKLVLLVHARMSPLFTHHDGLDGLLLFDPRWFLKPFATARLVRALRRGKFDLAIDCANPDAPSLNNLLLTRLTAASYRVGFRKAESEPFLNVMVDPQANTHFISNQLRLLRPFSQPSSFRLPRITLTDGERNEARAFLRAQTGNAALDAPPLMIFIPEPRLKSWPLECFLKMAEQLCGKGFPLLLSFGPRDQQRTHPDVQALAARHSGLVRVLQPLGLRQFAAVASQCRLFISNDCGPMHLAVAAGCPTLAIFLAGNRHTHGYHDGRRHFVVTGSSNEERLSNALSVASSFLASQPNNSSSEVEDNSTATSRRR